MSVHVSTRRRLPVAAVVVVGALLLSGCAASQAGEPSASPAGSASPSAAASAPTPTPSPTPAAVDLADPSSWIIGFTGVGPLAVGSDLAAATQSMTAFTSSTPFEGCPTIVSFDTPGVPNFVLTEMEGGTVERVVLQGGGSPSDFLATSPQTSGGIGIGATLPELQAAYPELTDLNDYFNPHYALSDGNGNWINFAVAEGVVYTIVVQPQPAIPRELCG